MNRPGGLVSLNNPGSSPRQAGRSIDARTGTSGLAGSTHRSGGPESHKLLSIGPLAQLMTRSEQAPLQWVAGTPPGTTSCFSTGVVSRSAIQ